MKVLHYLDSLNRGGTEVLALDICHNAAAAGLDLTLVSTKGGALEKEFEKYPKYVRLSRKLPIDFSLVRKLRRIVRENEIEIVHAHQAVEGLHLFLATIGLKGVRRVLSFHGLIADAKNHHALRFLIPRMDANVMVSDGLGDWLKGYYKLPPTTAFTTIYNGTDGRRLAPTGASLKAELGLTEDVRLIGMIANFYREPRKDQLTVCRALPEIFRRKEDLQCVFVGRIEDGAERKFEECVRFCRANGISDRVHFLGARDDIPDILSALDVFIFSSIHEGMPIALIEAMLAGVPLIVSHIAPFLEITDKGKYAEIFPVGDAAALSIKVDKLLTDRELTDSLALSAQRFAQERYSIEAHLKSLKNLYEKIL